MAGATAVQAFVDRYSGDASYGVTYAVRLTLVSGRSIIGRWRSTNDGVDLADDQDASVAFVPSSAVAMVEFVEYDERRAFGFRWFNPADVA